MPLKYFDLKKEDTRLVKCDDTLYKVKILPQKSVSNGGFPCSFQDAHRQIEDVFRALLYMDQRSVIFKPIHTSDFVVTTTKKAWKTCKKLEFNHYGKPLKACPFQFILKIELKDGLNQSKSITKTASENQKDSEQDKSHENNVNISDRSFDARNRSIETDTRQSESRKSKNENKDAKEIIESYKNTRTIKNVSLGDKSIIETEKDKEEKNRQILMERIRERERKKREGVKRIMEVDKIFNESGSKKDSNKSRKLYTTEVFSLTPGPNIQMRYNTRGSTKPQVGVSTGKENRSIQILEVAKRVEKEHHSSLSNSNRSQANNQVIDENEDEPINLRRSGMSKDRTNLHSNRTPKITQSNNMSKRRTLRSSQTPKSTQNDKMDKGQRNLRSRQTPKSTQKFSCSKRRTNLRSSQTPKSTLSNDRSKRRTNLRPSQTPKTVQRNNIEKTPRSLVKERSRRKSVSSSQESLSYSQRGLYSVKPLRRSILQKSKILTPLSKAGQSETDSNKTFSHRESFRLGKMKVISPLKNANDKHSQSSSESSSSSVSSRKSGDIRVRYPLRSKARSLSPYGNRQNNRSDSKNKDKPLKIDLFRPLQTSGKESERLLNLRTTTLKKTGRQLERVQLDRHDVEKEEIEESMKLQMMSKSKSPKQTKTSPRKRRASIFWDLVDTFISPVKKVLNG